VGDLAGDWDWKLTVTVGADERAELAEFLEDIARRLRRRAKVGNESLCAGEYRFEVAERAPADWQASNA
jgi:hypothetical protein